MARMQISASFPHGMDAPGQYNLKLLSVTLASLGDYFVLLIIPKVELAFLCFGTLHWRFYILIITPMQVRFHLTHFQHLITPPHFVGELVDSICTSSSSPLLY